MFTVCSLTVDAATRSTLIRLPPHSLVGTFPRGEGKIRRGETVAENRKHTVTDSSDSNLPFKTLAFPVGEGPTADKICYPDCNSQSEQSVPSPSLPPGGRWLAQRDGGSLRAHKKHIFIWEKAIFLGTHSPSPACGRELPPGGSLRFVHIVSSLLIKMVCQ